MVKVNHISGLLNHLPAISLSELEEYGLMNRVDTKYVFSSFKIPAILNELGGNYRVLDVDSHRVFPYHTTYLDTAEWLFFRQHITERGERNKVRFRKYELSGRSFLEVKKRTNKLRTLKWRIPKELLPDRGNDEEFERFVRKHVSVDTPPLYPVLINRFERITLAGITINERVTIDFNISFSDPAGNGFSIPFIGVIERKKPDYSNRSPLTEALKKNYVYPTGFSKYCLGTASLYNIPRNSLIKPKLLLINKIENEYNRQFFAG